MRSTTRMRLEDCAAVSAGLIRFYVSFDDRRRVPVLGRVVDVAPHLSATFAVHVAVNAQGWSVSDTESGGPEVLPKNILILIRRHQRH